jgi:hypothetical protein
MVQQIARPRKGCRMGHAGMLCMILVALQWRHVEAVQCKTVIGDVTWLGKGLELPTECCEYSHEHTLLQHT